MHNASVNIHTRALGEFKNVAHPGQHMCYGGANVQKKREEEVDQTSNAVRQRR